MARGNQTTDKKRGARKNRRATTEAEQPTRQPTGAKPIITGPTGQANYAEFVSHKTDALKKGQLRTKQGGPAGRPNQALNAARREARMAGARDVPVEGRAEKTKPGEQQKRAA
jgi:hypothetical protein